ncbi:hypothetical protein ACFL1B_06295 [Nanoarchaeota archaeon]
MKPWRVIFIVVAAALIINAAVFLFLYRPYVENEYYVREEVETLKGFKIELSVQHELPKEFKVTEPTKHGSDGIYAWPLTRENGTLVSVKAFTSTEGETAVIENYLVAEVSPYPVEVNVFKEGTPRGYQNVIQFHPDATISTLLALAAEGGITEMYSLPMVIGSGEDLYIDFRAFGPEQQENTTDNMMIVYFHGTKNGMFKHEVHTISTNITRQSEGLSRSKIVGKLLSIEKAEVGSSTGYIGEQSDFFTMSVS